MLHYNDSPQTLFKKEGERNYLPIRYHRGLLAKHPSTLPNQTVNDIDLKIPTYFNDLHQAACWVGATTDISKHSDYHNVPVRYAFGD